MDRKDALDREEMIAWVMRCWDDEMGEHTHLSLLRLMGPTVESSVSFVAGAFGAHPRHDGHLLATLSAIQILAMQDAMDRLDKQRIARCECATLVQRI